MSFDEEVSAGWRRYFSRHFQWRAEPAEHKGMAAFVEAHEEKCPPGRCVSGNKYEIRLMPTGFGMFVSIHCLVCQASEHVTDTTKF